MSNICPAVARGMFTNPTKKGGYGVPNTTIGAQHASLPEPYLVSRELDKVERKLARARVPKPFIGGAKGGIQNDNIFAYEPGAWAEPVKKVGSSINRARHGIYHGLDHRFLNQMASHDAAITLNPALSEAGGGGGRAQAVQAAGAGQACR